MTGLLPLDIGMVRGGVEAVILNLFEGFKELETIDLTHVSFNEEIDKSVTVEYATNIRIIYLPTRSGIKLADYFLNRAELGKLISQINPEIIHIHEVTPHLLRFTSLPMKNIVVTQHGIMREELKYAKGIGETMKCSFKALVEHFVFPMFIHVIFISQYNKKLFRGSCKVSGVIHNPVNPKFFQFSQPVQTNNSIVYVGVISRRKNLEMILHALAKLNKEGYEFRLHVVGGYKEKEYEKYINELVNTYNLGKQVCFYGWLTQEKILEVYNVCDIFMLPSRQETMPVSIGEAMAQGKVVIASDVGAVSEMITNTVSGFLFQKNNLDQLCNILRQLWNNTSLLETISQAGMKEARDKFDSKTVVAKTMDLYEEVLRIPEPQVV